MGLKRKKKEDENISEEEMKRRERQRTLRELALKLRAQGKVYKGPWQLGKDPADDRGAGNDSVRKRSGQSTPTLHVVILPIYWNRKEAEKQQVLAAADEVQTLLRQAGLKVHMDTGDQYTPGQKMKYWETRGIKVRLELGPKEALAGTAILARAHAPGEVADKRSVKVKRNLVPDTLQALKDAGVEVHAEAAIEAGAKAEAAASAGAAGRSEAVMGASAAQGQLTAMKGQGSKAAAKQGTTAEAEGGSSDAAALAPRKPKAKRANTAAEQGGTGHAGSSSAAAAGAPGARGKATKAQKAHPAALSAAKHGLAGPANGVMSEAGAGPAAVASERRGAGPGPGKAEPSAAGSPLPGAGKKEKKRRADSAQGQVPEQTGAGVEVGRAAPAGAKGVSGAVQRAAGHSGDALGDDFGMEEVQERGGKKRGSKWDKLKQSKAAKAHARYLAAAAEGEAAGPSSEVGAPGAKTKGPKVVTF